MYYCIKCKRPHETSSDQVIFRTGFCHVDSNRMNVGYCQPAATVPRRDNPINLQHEKIRWISNRSKQRLLKI